MELNNGFDKVFCSGWEEWVWELGVWRWQYYPKLVLIPLDLLLRKEDTELVNFENFMILQTSTY